MRTKSFFKKGDKVVSVSNNIFLIQDVGICLDTRTFVYFDEFDNRYFEDQIRKYRQIPDYFLNCYNE